ncbi:MAG: NAD(P)-binding domain-containing protein, partial [Lawsonibacter sp.]|nr:NAD(P)-binding domain-containing protein [Lawsonibacter sp.]
MDQTIGFIGTGNMGSAIAKAAAKSGLAETILLANRTPAKAAALAAELPGGTLSTNEEIARTAKLIFLGVKPQMMQLVLD